MDIKLSAKVSQYLRLWCIVDENASVNCNVYEESGDRISFPAQTSILDLSESVVVMLYLVDRFTIKTNSVLGAVTSGCYIYDQQAMTAFC